MSEQTFSIAFARVAELVNDFQANEQQFLDSSYSEAQARLDFIDKFWIALGWDVNHEQQKNPYEQEVKVERGVAVSNRLKKADYAFFAAPNFRDVKFYVEAKKPARNIDNPDDYFQAMRYGWSSNTPLAVLTDFEQFRIIDCRYKPNIQTATNFADKKFDYREYTDETKFAEIYYLFSREAVSKGSLEEYAKNLPKRGRGAKQGRLFANAIQQSVDASFLAELDIYRESLAKAFKNRNPDLDSEDLTEAVARTLDRLVFMRFLEDKLIEPETMIDKFDSWAAFVNASNRLNKIYNGIIFRHHAIIDAGNFVPPKTEFTDICDALSPKDSPYDFNSIPIHILGSIYERFLGKTIEATETSASVVEKPEVRKAGGVYYTPEYIVRYIVENTIGKLIAVKKPKEIAEMRFADIACGSGSFLIGILDVLLRYHTEFYNRTKTNRQEGLRTGCIENEDGTLRLSLRQKKEILLNNIYGVDIDAQAVEVAQLSLFLKLLEDETTGSARGFQLEFRETMLPSLDKNIVHGNSLVDYDILDGKLFERHEERKLNPMSYEDKFPEIMRRGGFDAIVGNPPYGAQISDQQTNYLKAKFVSASYKIDTYPLFIEKSLSLIKKSSLTGVIVPSAWVASKYDFSLRELLVKRANIESIVIAPDKVFKDATVETLVLIFSNKENVSNQILIERWDTEEKETYFLLQDKIGKNKDYVFSIYSNPETNNLIEKIQLNSFPLSEIGNAVWGVKVYQRGKGVPPQKGYEAEAQIFHSEVKAKETHRPLLGGSEIMRYLTKWNGKYIDYGKWLAEPRNEEWFNDKRMLIREVTSKGIIQAAIVYGDFVFSNSVDGVKINEDFGYSYSFLLSLLNSTMMSFYNANTSANAFKNTFPKVLIKDLLNFPICKINFANVGEKAAHDKIVLLVEQMLEAKKQLQTARTDSDKDYYQNRCHALDRQIDNLVYQLYELTEDEIKIVEGVGN